jgi:putative membrane protein
MSVLTNDEQKRVELAIARLEAESATELVVAVLPRSGDYRFPRLLAACAWALAASLASATFWFEHDALLPFAVLLVAGGVAWFLFGVPALWRALISPRSAETEVSRRAFALFSERGLVSTRDRTGMLILVSELEHRVVILGDRGIHERVGDAGWAEHVQRIVAAIRAGRAADGLIETIEALGLVHAELLPVGAGDTNELSNEIIRK